MKQKLSGYAAELSLQRLERALEALIKKKRMTVTRRVRGGCVILKPAAWHIEKK
jgi:hypothetical protein